MAEWDARLYSKFERERTLLARDLCAAIPLNRADAAAFEAEVLAGVTAAYPIQANGEIIFRFPRFFFTAIK